MQDKFCRYVKGKDVLMNLFFVDPAQIGEKYITITGSDVNHIKNVLRMKTGQEIAVSNGMDSREYRCGIYAMEEDRIVCELRFIKEDGVELPSKIYLFQGLPKADKMELIIQKAVELGVYEIIPVAARRCVVKLDDKKAAARTARWQGIAQAAAKQSKRRIVPRVTEVMSLKQAAGYAAAMDVKMIPYELSEGMEQTKSILEGLGKGQQIAVFIGPEGGFEEEEIKTAMDYGICPVTLGKRILRTETAGFTVLAWIMYQLEE